MRNDRQFQTLAVGLLGMAGLLYLLTYHVDRSQFAFLVALFSGMFGLYAWLSLSIKSFKPYQLALGGAILLRLILLPAIPWLSDDVFRFIWDGRLLAQGVDPFAHTPQWFIEHPKTLNDLPGVDQSLFGKLNSPDYYTVYPPFCQGLFALAGWLCPHSEWGAMLVLRGFMLMAEGVSLYILEQLRQRFNLPYRVVLLYALNPLVIAELTGNLHFEGFMITFLLGTFWLAIRGRWFWGTVAFAGAFLAKLLPVIYLPGLIRRTGWPFPVLTGFLSMVFLAATMLWISSPKQLWNMGQSLDLYFQTFEFNASVYYLLRWMGFQWAGYNMISTIGPILAALATILILLYAYQESNPKVSNWAKAIVLTSALYLAMATTVHPWYVTPLIAFSVFTSYTFPLVWSFTIILSYATYQTTPYQEQYELTALSYLIVYSVAAYEIWGKPSKTGLNGKISA